MYNSLVAHNDSLQAIIEPVTTSRADALASLVSSALQTNFEGGDEIVIAGNRHEGFCLHVTIATTSKQQQAQPNTFFHLVTFRQLSSQVLLCRSG